MGERFYVCFRCARGCPTQSAKHKIGVALRVITYVHIAKQGVPDSFGNTNTTGQPDSLLYHVTPAVYTHNVKVLYHAIVAVLRGPATPDASYHPLSKAADAARLEHYDKSLDLELASITRKQRQLQQLQHDSDLQHEHDMMRKLQTQQSLLAADQAAALNPSDTGSKAIISPDMWNYLADHQ